MNNSCYHIINDIPCPYNKNNNNNNWSSSTNSNSSKNNNALKGASSMNQSQQQQQNQRQQQSLIFTQQDIDFINTVLKISGYAVSRLNPQTQEHNNLIDNVGKALQIISTKNKGSTTNSNSTKGASDSAARNKYQALVNIRNMC